MSDRERRFERLERERREGPSGAGVPEEAPDLPSRFGGFEPPAPTPAATVPASAADRFRDPPPRPIDVAQEREEEQPFQRCMWCETDSSRYARSCERCGADLGTPEQRAFNERLWAARQGERAEERRREEERRAELEREAAAEAHVRRRAAEQMAAEVGRRERERLDLDLGRPPLLDLLASWGRRLGWRRRW